MMLPNSYIVNDSFCQAKLGWVALFSASPTTQPTPIRESLFLSKSLSKVLQIDSLCVSNQKLVVYTKKMSEKEKTIHYISDGYLDTWVIKPSKVLEDYLPTIINWSGTSGRHVGESWLVSDKSESSGDKRTVLVMIGDD